MISLEQSHAVVLFDAVQNLAASRFTNPANLLGLAMAHEMGHLYRHGSQTVKAPLPPDSFYSDNISPPVEIASALHGIRDRLQSQRGVRAG